MYVYNHCITYLELWYLKQIRFVCESCKAIEH